MRFDAIIIGTGQAGPSLAASMAKNGWKVAIIEKGDLGGTCVNVGCTPTKAYVASARRAFIAKNSAELGIEVNGNIQVKLKTIKERKDKIIEDSRNGLGKMLEENDHIQLIRGKGRFIDNNTVSVEGKTYKADKIFINVGAKPRIPDGFKEVDYLTNESILELEEIPEHLIIVGGGYIGLEFGQMFRRFGSKVTILDRGEQLLKKEDPEFGKAIQEIFENEGIEVRLNSECISAAINNGKIEVSVNCDESEINMQGTHLLMASGRGPNTSDLGLENTSVSLDERGYIKVNDELQTSAANIWALGDCNGQGAFTHTAYNDFQIVNSHLFEEKKRKLSDRFTCYAAFIDPPLARVGMNATEIKNAGIKAKVASRPMKKIARAKEMGETQGMLKIYIEEETGMVLGATFLGTGADEYIHTVIDQMYAGQPFTIMRDAVHIHPTVSELIPTMLENPNPIGENG
ncbi:FAD-containing oxidoreductase [Christiangramia echinicola]|uniref:Pyruvate/2-oxoglutarate dehydrogenase complex, dihydrolipoamide dehydrogenase (E3) component n=1 Tax=Christiangramia echinicola TaxID=279359 RepID=A0A1H1SE06_9FLAO|nr:FAD-containing oxidoreductase [Christiangramia echinicola]SDS46172.1 Pyruvate/2-oxoglutarate dehydrogenase complex, dihydrolipoamide dehydrogenase (E3) component [Christiangramia echinicola]